MASCIRARLEVLLVYQVLARQLTKKDRQRHDKSHTYTSEKPFSRTCQVAETMFLWLFQHENAFGITAAIDNTYVTSYLKWLLIRRNSPKCWPCVGDG